MPVSEIVSREIVKMVLNPESLGKVSIQLINTKEGLSAQFTVATQEARNLIMKGLDGLKDTLMSHGVSVDNVSVKINDAQESEYNADIVGQLQAIADQAAASGHALSEMVVGTKILRKLASNKGDRKSTRVNSSHRT